ncbi:hypothetical protein [Heyndrickxia oleronia]|uniref:hypothetical protein n=1 Tax=Heyndrickxia oleronia TaxID=38875 RepID=UPI0024687F04|nr:hypothetical protein [Heyndrickxia oleronia]
MEDLDWEEKKHRIQALKGGNNKLYYILKKITYYEKYSICRGTGGSINFIGGYTCNAI